MYLDTDVSSSDVDTSDTSLPENDSDTEMIGSVPETAEDLRIDMKSPWAFNKRLLAKTRR
jgi:hypothetical protein